MTNLDHAPILAERRRLDRLLERWQVGDIGPWDMVVEAEAIQQAWFEQREPCVTPDGISMLQTLAPDDPRSIGTAVVELLASAHTSFLLPEDIAIMRAFLDTPFGHEMRAWQQFDAYWQAIDYTARQAQVDALYFDQPPS